MTGKRPIFRPWGLLDWVLPRLSVTEWSFLGGLSSEDRSAAAWEATLSATNVTNSEFIRVLDPPSRYSAAITSKCDAIALRLLTLGLDPSSLRPYPLFVRTEELIK